MNDYARIARIIRYLDEHHIEQPDLATLAAQVGLSPGHFHRLFSAWAAITPKDFLQSLTLAHARRLLAEGRNVLDAALGVGLSGPGRLHDLCVTLEAASPGEIKAGGAGWTLAAGYAASPFGPCLIGTGPRGICHLAFVPARGDAAEWAVLQSRWPRAQLQRDDAAAEQSTRQIFTPPDCAAPHPALKAFVQGSAFQVRVWQALLQVRPGTLISYGQLAAALGTPRAARAVGTAAGQNALAFLIPCHRVIRATGVLGGYRWGTVRKRAMLAWESARAGNG